MFTDSRTTNFYYAFLFLPEAKRRAIEAVYAFARGGDDAADDWPGSSVARREVRRYGDLLDACYQQDAARLTTPALRALAEAIQRFQIPRQPFDDLLLGLEMDLRMDHNSAGYRSFDELEVYCYRVASTIGLIAIEIFGYRNPRARDYAINLGKALQMVNILRDVGGDAQRGRVYLPQEDLARFGVDQARLAENRYSANFIELMRFEAGRAHAFFDRARQLLPPEDRQSLRAAEIMGAIYWRLLREIERRSYRVLGERIGISRPVKFWTAFRVYRGAEWHK